MELRARNRATSKTTIALLVASIAGLAVVGGGAARAATRHPESRAPLEARSAARANLQLQVVLDTSASVPAHYRIEALRGLADEVGSWPRPVALSGKSERQPGLIVQVRGISAYSYSPESVLGTWSVRGIPGVQALPSAVTPDFTQRVITYKNERNAAADAYTQSVADARRAATGLRRLRPKMTHASEIEGAVSAAAQSLSPAGVRKLAIISDLAQNRTPQIAGSLQGVDVIIAHICQSASTCRSQERAWGGRLRRRGATTVTFVRIERFAAAIETFLREV